MIHASKKDTDMGFIAKTLRERGLDPKPLPGFWDLPGAWDDSNRWRRAVERYSWGSIVFLSDRKADEHYTLVVEGELDVKTGVVKSSGKPEPLPVPWYNDLARRLNMEGAKAPVIEVPRCLGHHVSDYTCDGGYNPAQQLEKPCAWRSRCIALQGHCAKANCLPAEVLKGKAPDEVARFTAGLLPAELAAAPVAPAAAPSGSAQVALARPQEATPVPATAAKPSPAKPTPKAAAKVAPAAKPAAPVPAAGPNTDAMTLFKGIWGGLQKALESAGLNTFVDGRKRKYLPSEDGAEVGDIFLSDRSQTSAYISVYAQPEKGRKVALFAVRLRTGVVGIQLPLEPEHALLSKHKANVVKWKDGKFLCELKPVPTSVPVQAVCDLILKAIQSGAIPLPGAV